MSQIQDDLSYLSETTGARPAGTEEENQAGLYIQRQFEANKKFETSTEEFASSPRPDLVPLICFGASLLFAILAMFVHALTIPAFIVTLAAAVLYVLEILDIPVLSRPFTRGLTQNVVAKYKPDSSRVRSRKVVLVANYDSAKVHPELSPSFIPALPIVQKLCLAALVVMPIIWLIRMIAGVSASSMAWNIVTIIVAILLAIPVVISIMHMTSDYNNGANDNASSVAVMMEVARQIANGEIVDKPKPQEDIDGTIIHGGDEARAAGVVPEGATLSYDDSQDEEAQLNAAKAAVANLTGKEVDGIKPGQKMSEFVKPARRQKPVRGANQELSRHNTVHPSDAQNNNSHASASSDDQNDRTQIMENNGNRKPETTSQTSTKTTRSNTRASKNTSGSAQDTVKEDKQDESSEQVSQEAVPEGMVRTSDGDVVPSWFAEAQRKAGSNGKTPIASNGHSRVRRSRYADALDAAERTAQTNHPKFVPSASVNKVQKSVHPDASEILDAKQKLAARSHQNSQTELSASQTAHTNSQSSNHVSEQSVTTTQNEKKFEATTSESQGANEHVHSQGTTQVQEKSEQTQKNQDAQEEEPMINAAEESRRRLEKYGFKPRKRPEYKPERQTTHPSNHNVPLDTDSRRQSQNVSRETSTQNTSVINGSQDSNVSRETLGQQPATNRDFHVNQDGTPVDTLRSQYLNDQLKADRDRETEILQGSPTPQQNQQGKVSRQPQASQTQSSTVQTSSYQNASASINQPTQLEQEDQNRSDMYDSYEDMDATQSNTFTDEVSNISHKVASVHPFKSIKKRLSGLSHRNNGGNGDYDAFNDEELNNLSEEDNEETQSMDYVSKDSSPRDAFTGMPIAEEDAEEGTSSEPANRDATVAMPHIDVSEKVTNYSVENDANAEARKLQSRPSRELHHAPQQTSNRVVFDETNTPVSRQEDEIEQSENQSTMGMPVSNKPEIHSNIGKVIPRVSEVDGQEKTQPNARINSSRQNQKNYPANNAAAAKAKTTLTQEEARATVRKIVESTPSANAQSTGYDRPESYKQRAPISDMQNGGNVSQRHTPLESGAIPKISLNTTDNSAAANANQPNRTIARSGASQASSQQSSRRNSPAIHVAKIEPTNLANLPTMSGRITNEKSVTDIPSAHNTTAAQSSQAQPESRPSINVPSVTSQKTNSQDTAGSNEKVSLTGSFQAVGSTGAFKPVTDDLVKGMKPTEMYVDDADESTFEENTTETGAYAGAGYMNIPKEHKGLFSKLRQRREQKREEEEEVSADKWLDVDEDYNPTKVGAERGGWESFRPDDLSDGYEEDQTSTEYDNPDSRTNKKQTKGKHEADSWNGGAYSNEHADYDDAHIADSTEPMSQYIPQSEGNYDPTGRMPIQKGPQSDRANVNREANDQGSQQTHQEQDQQNIPVDNELNDKVLQEDEQKVEDDIQRIKNEEQEDIYQMRPSLNTEVWFVALGSELSNNSGSKAFLARHADELRGSIIVNLEALGAGELTYIDEEGAISSVKASSRMKRLVSKAAQDSGVNITHQGKLTWKNSIVSIAHKYHLQGMSLVGMEHGKPALMGEADDTQENVSPSKMNQAVKFIAGLIRSI